MASNDDSTRERAEETHPKDFVTYRIAQLHPKLNSQAAHILREHAGLSLVQWRIVALLQVAGRPISSRELTLQVSMDQGLFSRSLKTLVADGLVSTAVDPTDQRRSLLTLTKTGLALYEKTIPVMRQRQKHLMRNLSVEEREVLFRALDKLSENAERKSF